jgi:hypothetical protein
MRGCLFVLLALLGIEWKATCFCSTHVDMHDFCMTVPVTHCSFGVSTHYQIGFLTTCTYYWALKTDWADGHTTHATSPANVLATARLVGFHITLRGLFGAAKRSVNFDTTAPLLVSSLLFSQDPAIGICGTGRVSEGFIRCYIAATHVRDPG